MIDLTESSFGREVVQSVKPVVVLFWALWSAPSRQMIPILDELSEETDRVKFAQINIDDAPTIAETYDVKSLPTLLFFQSGSVVDTIVGAVSKSKVKAKVDAL